MQYLTFAPLGPSVTCHVSNVNGAYTIYFCHGPRRRQAMALASPIKGVSDRFTNRQEQTCLHWPVD